MRTGIIAEKLCMSQIFENNGIAVPITILKADPCFVIENKCVAKDGSFSVKLGSREIAAEKISKPLRGYYEKKGISAFKISKEFRVSAESLPDVGSKIYVDHFSSGQFVDVTGISKGKGFAGGMKRHGFGGLRASHGVSVSHRSHGSTGNRTDPGKVFKGKKMAGHMGASRVTIMNLKIHSVDVEKSLIFVIGAIPGPRGGTVFVRDAIKMIV